jgi:AraC-like DNA-binding protein
MDALSDVLKSVRLEGAVFLNAEFTEPWCIRGRYGLTSVRERLSGAEHVVFFHFLVEGRCLVRLAEGGDMLEVTAGDVVLFPQDDQHLMGSDLRLSPVDTSSLMRRDAEASHEFIHLRYGGGGTPTRFVCGYLACSRSVCRPLLESLPRLLRVTVGDGPASSLLRELLRMGVLESQGGRPGAESMLAKLSELVLVEALRRYVMELPASGKGWLAGVRDERIGRALALLHSAPDRAWTVDDLAREVALSRSALAERFATLVGEPPVQYLLRWRLALAARALRAGRDAISRVAQRSGYESEAAFSRAFKREFGMPPAAWRKAGAT